jgi:osmotically-inducible protein OsmY
MNRTVTFFIFTSVFSSVSLFSGNANSRCPNGNCNAGYSQNQPSNYYQGGDQQSNQRDAPPANQAPNQKVQSYENRGTPQGYYDNRQPQADAYRNMQEQGNQGYFDNRQGQNYQGNYQTSYQGQNYQEGNQGYYDNRQSQGGYYDNGQQGQGYYENTEYSNQVQPSTDQKNVSDQEIQKKVQSSLSSWFSKEYKSVTSNVNNGNVTLQGTVNTLEEKKKLDETVRKIDGVRQINNQVVVTGAKTAWNEQSAADKPKMREDQQKYPNDYAATDADRQLNVKIRDKLAGGWFTKGYDALILRTSNGILIITGAVDSPDDIKKINEQLKGVEGLRSVSNQAMVKNK